MVKELDEESVSRVGQLFMGFNAIIATAHTYYNYDKFDIVCTTTADTYLLVESKLDCFSRWNFDESLDWSNMEKRRYGNYWQSHREYNNKIDCTGETGDRVIVLDIEKYKALKTKHNSYLAFVFTDGILLLKGDKLKAVPCRYKCKKTDAFGKCEMEWQDKALIDVEKSVSKFYPADDLLPIHVNYHTAQGRDMEYINNSVISNKYI